MTTLLRAGQAVHVDVAEVATVMVHVCGVTSAPRRQDAMRTRATRANKPPQAESAHSFETTDARHRAALRWGSSELLPVRPYRWLGVVRERREYPFLTSALGAAFAACFRIARAIRCALENTQVGWRRCRSTRRVRGQNVASVSVYLNILTVFGGNSV